MLKFKHFGVAVTASAFVVACATTKTQTNETAQSAKEETEAVADVASKASEGADSMEKKAEADAVEAVAASGSIVEVAAAAGSFGTLITALKAAGLDKTLSGDGPFTVFAPTDEAFQKLPAGTVESLLKDTDKLGKILSLHVVSGKAMAADVTDMTSVTTLGGKELSVDVSEGVRIGQATVVKPDVKAKNGVIHVIDRVILPE